MSVRAQREPKIREMLEDNAPVWQIADQFGVTKATIYGDIKALGLQTPERGKGRDDKALKKRRQTAANKVEKVNDRRRFRVTPVPIGKAAILVDAETQGTRFPSRVFLPDGSEPVLKDGASNSKIGGDVLVGRLKGALILTLTLEERATCPKSCEHWRSCYGNGMQHSRRWQAGPALEEQIRKEVEHACAQNDLVLIRLHILGDFYSFDYLCLWADLLDHNDNLHVFGFTAHKRKTHLGDKIAILRCVYPGRFMIRHSGETGEFGSFTIDFPTDKKSIGDAVVCPEQVSAMNGHPDREKHCGNCAVCWETSRPIVFVEH